MPINSHIQQIDHLLSDKDLPEFLLMRLQAYNISDAARFLELADLDFYFLQRFLSIPDDDLHKHIKNVKLNHPNLINPQLSTWKAPQSGVIVDNLQEYEDRIKKSSLFYNKRTSEMIL